MNPKAVTLIVVALVFGSACQFFGYGPVDFGGKKWLRYLAQETGGPVVDPVGACEAYYQPPAPDAPPGTPGKWLCYSGSHGFWQQRVPLDGNGCIYNWDTGDVLACPWEPNFPKMWDLNGPAGYASGQRGPI